MDRYYNPYGVISNIGAGQTPLYTATGEYSPRYGHVCQHMGTLSRDYHQRVVANPNWPQSTPYSNQQMANMQEQLQYDGDHGAYAWRMSMMNDAEMRREISRYS